MIKLSLLFMKRHRFINVVATVDIKSKNLKGVGKTQPGYKSMNLDGNNLAMPVCLNQAKRFPRYCNLKLAKKTWKIFIWSPFI